MTDSHATTSPTAPDPVPYVGLRSFGPEEREWFYGRDADAQFLVDKVLSARLTLLYAPSGVGKSSLLRARVIPSLEQEECRVLYFDAWAGLEPASALKEKLADMARSAGIADPLAGAPTIAELVRLSANDGRTLVLVLDQFEEFLINHAQELDPLRREIAALVRSQSVDARVVISLREEFLAAIEPFRQEILTLFQSTYRLESLPAEEVRKAVINPAARFGGEVEPALADRLVADLSEVSSDGGPPPADVRPVSGWRTWIAGVVDRVGGQAGVSGTPGPTGGPDSIQRVKSGTIDLPMLQIVCEHMWRAAPVVDGRRLLSLEFYEQLGGKRKILDEHIRSRMPRRWRDQLFTATLMRFLAPPSGLKISYSAADLAEYSHLDQRRVEAELNRLSGANARILRQRNFKESVRFELQHDALIRHVTPWRDAVLARAAALRRLEWAGGGVALAVVLVASQRLYHWKEVRDNTDGRLSVLRNMSIAERDRRAANSFETVANYLLFQEGGTERFDHLKRLLVTNQDLLPEGYATGTTDVDTLPPANPGETAFAIRFSTDRRFDGKSFTRAWTEVAQQMSRRWGIPVSNRVELKPDQDFPRATIRFEFQKKGVPPMDVEAFEGMALVSMEKAPASAQEFHKRFESDWLDLQGPTNGKWWGVPRWSLPVWRAAGLTVSPAGAYPALALNATLEKDPTILLTSASTKFLVQRVARLYPCTAAEVWAIRGELLQQDLVAWINGSGNPRPLLHPHLVFDTLAALGPTTAAKAGANTSAGYLDTLKAASSTPWPQSSGPKTACEPPTFGLSALQWGDDWLPPLEPKVRIALGAELVRAWTNEPQAVTGAHVSTMARQSEESTAAQAPEQRREIGMSPELTEALEHYRENVFKRSGIWLPDVKPVNASTELIGDLEHHFRVGLLDGRDQAATSVDARGTDQEGIDRLISALDAAISPATLAWVDAEYVGGMLNADDRLPILLKNLGVSVSDLKLLLRAVISPPSTEAGNASSPGVGSVRDSDWLIPSLVFWKAYYEAKGAPTVADLLPELAGRLRRLQARRDAPVGAPQPSAVSALIHRGVDALETRRWDDAEKLFDQALREGPRAEVERLFVDRYAMRWQASRRARTAANCVKPMEGKLDPSLRIEVEALLDAPESRRDRAASRNLALCLLSSMPQTVPRAKAALRLKIAGQYGAPEDWPALQAQWLGLQLLQQYDPSRDPGTTKDQGARFLTAAVRRVPSNLEAEKAFDDLAGICLEPGPMNWCWPVLAAVADARPYAWTFLDYALFRLNRETNADAQEAVRWADRAQLLQAADKAATKEARQRFDFWTTYIRAYALWTLGINGDTRRLDEAQPLIPALIESPAKSDPRIEASALLLAIRLLLDGPHPDPGRAATLRDLGLKKRLDDPNFLSRTIFTGLRSGDVAAVRQAVREASDKASEPGLDSDRRTGFLFSSAVGGLIAGDDRSEWVARQFIRTGHLYAPLVSMLLSAGTNGVARDDATRLFEERWAHDESTRLLEERWARVDRTTWDARLQGGDSRAWYEMLVGSFSGKVPASEIFDPLRDDSTFASSKFAGLPVPRRALLTEAYFYDAVRLRAAGNHAGEIANLRRVVELGHKSYVEYDMAVHLLRVESTAGKAVASGQP